MVVGGNDAQGPSGAGAPSEGEVTALVGGAPPATVDRTRLRALP
jgi:hypothetical protein